MQIEKEADKDHSYKLYYIWLTNKKCLLSDNKKPVSEHTVCSSIETEYRWCGSFMRTPHVAVASLSFQLLRKNWLINIKYINFFIFSDPVILFQQINTKVLIRNMQNTLHKKDIPCELFLKVKCKEPSKYSAVEKELSDR